MSIQLQARPNLSRPEQVGARVGGLFEQHGRMVLAICGLVLRDREEAEDAAQQTFLSAHRGLLAGTEPQDPAAWLATIARNECHRRRRAPDAVVVPLEGNETMIDGDPQHALGRSEEIELLRQALAELPAAHRQAIVLREFYGLSYAEIAVVLGASGPAVESLIFKGRRRLQERLRPLRRASGILLLPDGLRDALAATIPGFNSGTSAAATGGATATAFALPFATKAAAIVLVVGVGSGIAASTGSSHTSGSVSKSKSHSATAARTRPAAARVRPASHPVLSPTSASDASAPLPAAPESSDAASPVQGAKQPEALEAPTSTAAPETSEPTEPAADSATSEPTEPVEVPEVPEPAEPAEAG